MRDGAPVYGVIFVVTTNEVKASGTFRWRTKDHSLGSHGKRHIRIAVHPALTDVEMLRREVNAPFQVRLGVLDLAGLHLGEERAVDVVDVARERAALEGVVWRICGCLFSEPGLLLDERKKIAVQKHARAAVHDEAHTMALEKCVHEGGEVVEDFDQIVARELILVVGRYGRLLDVGLYAAPPAGNEVSALHGSLPIGWFIGGHWSALAPCRRSNLRVGRRGTAVVGNIFVRRIFV